MPAPRRYNRGSRGFCLFPGYRYCGPGCSGPGAPVNAVDAACKAHDACYRQHGMSHRQCDEQLINRLRPLMQQRNEEGRRARQLYQLMRLKMLF